MNARTHLRPLAVLSLCGMVGCGVFSDDSDGLHNVDDLVGWIERVHIESELSDDSASSALRTLGTIVSPDFQGDPVFAYREFVSVVDRSEAQAVKLREAVDEMKYSADEVFTQWSADLMHFSNLAMRGRSQARLDAARRRYQAIVAAVEPALTAYDTFNVDLRDISLFLGNDFNPSAVREIGPEIQMVTARSTDLKQRFDACLIAARTYVDSGVQPIDDRTVLPSQPAAPGPGTTPDPQLAPGWQPRAETTYEEIRRGDPNRER